MNTNPPTTSASLLLVALNLTLMIWGLPVAADDGVRIPDELRAVIGFDPAESSALFVGVSKFDDEVLAEVPYSVDDAVDLAHLFAMELQLVTPKKVTLCLSGEPKKPASVERLEQLVAAGAKKAAATQSNIFKLLDESGRASGENGLFIVSLATHGFNDQGADYLVASDTLARRVATTGVPVSVVFDDVSQAKAPRRVLLLDACREQLTAGTRAIAGDPHSAMSRTLHEAIAEARGQVVLSGTSLGGYAYDDEERGNGVFSGAVMDGLRGGAAADSRGLITVAALSEFVDRQVRDWVSANRPGHADVSTGIEARLDGPAARLPLAASASLLEEVKQYAVRKNAALEKLRENLGGPITGVLFDDLQRALASDAPNPERLELLTEIEGLDGSQRNKRILVDYFALRKDELRDPATRAVREATQQPKPSVRAARYRLKLEQLDCESSQGFRKKGTDEPYIVVNGEVRWGPHDVQCPGEVTLDSAPIPLREEAITIELWESDATESYNRGDDLLGKVEISVQAGRGKTPFLGSGARYHLTWEIVRD